MASTGEQLAQNRQRIDGLQARVIGLTPSPSLYALAGAYVAFGCKVTEGDDPEDFIVLLDGLAAGDEDHWNPDVVETPLRGFQYPNIANLADGSFFSTNLTAEVSTQPSTGLARYDIAYIFVGPTGPGFGISSGTPSEAVKADFTENGLVETPYDAGTDAALPLGGFPVARIYVADTSEGIANAQIADLRSFDGRLKGTAFTFEDLTPTQKDDLADGFITEVTELRDQTEVFHDDAAISADTSTNQAALAEQSKNQAQAYAAAAETSKDQAEAIVVSGDVSYVPAANQVPLARSNGRIDPQWIQGAAAPENWVDTSQSATGILVPDTTNTAFTSQMTREFQVFIPANLTEEVLIYSDTFQHIAITTERKLRVNRGASSYVSDALSVFDDWTTIAFSVDDNDTDTTVFLFVVDGVQLGATQVYDYSEAALIDMFDGDGFLWEFSDPYELGNPSIGDPVTTITDKSGNGEDGEQAVVAEKMVFARVPYNGRKNLLLWSEDFSNSAWIKDGSSISANTTQAPGGMMTAYKIVELDNNGIHGVRQISGSISSSYQISCYAKAAERSVVMIERGYGGANSDTASFDLLTGEIIQSSGTVSSVSMSSAGNGWYRCSLIMPVANNSLRCGIRMQNSADPAINSPDKAVYTGDGVSGLFLWGAQIGPSGADTPYQRVTTQYDITESGQPTAHYLYNDGIDDNYDVTLPEITDGTIVLAGMNGIWIDDFSIAAGTFTVGPTTYTGGPAGIMQVIGNWLGGVVLDRALTEAERARVIAYFKSKGAPGVFETDGINLVTNSGNPFVSVDGFTAQGSESVGLSGDFINITGASSGGASQDAPIAVDAGDVFLFESSIRVNSGANGFVNLRPSRTNISDSSPPLILGNQSSSSSLTDVRNITASAATHDYYLWIAASSNHSIDYGFLSLKKYTLNTGS